MELLLFRHGIADPYDGGIPDEDRPLTKQGVQRTTEAAAGLARIADCPDVILTSPKKRARQTANIIGEVFDLTPEAVDVLAEGPPRDIVRTLSRRRESSILLVGHEPWMSELIELLCANKAPHGFIELKKAACALVEAPIRSDEPAAPAMLRWLLPPRVLRALAG